MTTNAFLLSPFYVDQAVPGAPALAKPQWTITDPAMNGTERLERVAQVHAPLARLVAEALQRGERPVSVVGDCCSTIAVMAGLQRGGLAPLLVWLDAHGDFNTFETSPSGFIGGMPVAMLVGRGEQGLVRAAGMKNLPETDVVLVGGRDLDPGERDALARSAVRHVKDPGRVLETLPAGRPIYVHFDPDIINPADAPAMHYPTAGGPALEDVRTLCRRLAATGRVVAASMTLWELKDDGDGRTERACLAALGDLVSG